MSWQSGAAALCVIFVLVSRVTAQEPCRPTAQQYRGTVVGAGYQFEYESFQGDHCRGYRLRNTPGKPLTPVKWMYGGLLFLDTNLAACSLSARECPWITTVHYSIAATHSTTSIGYGINKEQHSQNAIAVVEEKYPQTTLSRWQNAAMSFSGDVADIGNKPHYVALSLKTDQFTPLSLCLNFIATQGPSPDAKRAPVDVIWYSDEVTYFITSVKAGETKKWQVALGKLPNQNPLAEATIALRQGDKILAYLRTPSPEPRP